MMIVQDLASPDCRTKKKIQATASITLERGTKDCPSAETFAPELF